MDVLLLSALFKGNIVFPVHGKVRLRAATSRTHLIVPDATSQSPGRDVMSFKKKVFRLLPLLLQLLAKFVIPRSALRRGPAKPHKLKRTTDLTPQTPPHAVGDIRFGS